MIKIKRALVSVSDKTGLEQLGKFLNGQGCDVLSTGNTLKKLKEVCPAARPVDDYTNFPEMMDGRLKTLHPKVHGGLLALTDNESHVRSMKEHGIESIDLLVVNLYPFAETVASGKSKEDCIENIDIGGPAMIRAGAKNHRFTVVVCDPADYTLIINEVNGQGGVSYETAAKLAGKAFNHTAAYDALIAQYFNEHHKDEFPEKLTVTYQKQQSLRYGENPHQSAAYYRPAAEIAEEKAKGIQGSIQLQGKELSYNNLLDLSSAFMASISLPGTGVVIVKHLNPCGAAFSGPADESVQSAFLKARKCDPVSAFGGVIAVNGTIGEQTAATIAEQFSECIIAREFTDEALKVFEQKKNLRLLKIDQPERFLQARKEIRSVHDGILYGDFDVTYNSREEWTVATEKQPTEEQWKSLEFAWRLVKHVKSNAIVFTGPDASLGIGAGQMSRLDSADIAARKAESFGLDLKGSAAASDAFFPFRDGLDVLAKAGAAAVIQPGGSVRDEEVIAAANEHGIVMVFTGMRHFRH